MLSVRRICPLNSLFSQVPLMRRGSLGWHNECNVTLYPAYPSGSHCQVSPFPIHQSIRGLFLIFACMSAQDYVRLDSAIRCRGSMFLLCVMGVSQAFKFMGRSLFQSREPLNWANRLFCWPGPLVFLDLYSRPLVLGKNSLAMTIT